MNNERTSRKEKNQNIQVFVRLRPINSREREIKSLGVVEVCGTREVIVRQSPLQTNHNKKFTFDRAFGPNSKQVDVYHAVVSPLIEEVLSGYNCTVFAYGQTGTGKTHTMVGESSGSEHSWQNDPMAGIIPRSLSQLFDELRLTNSEYTVRVSYLELYNEELFDLLSTSEDNSKLRIYEDVTRKGSNIVNGLEEITVYNKNEVYKIMEQGQERKRMASTLMNAQSSRSHTVFTIVVHIKETSPEGEELMKVGKLNLVDLAGSENISKAGSDNPQKRERARECVNINQSLLTLGRVITSLVERHPHIPYRESKLTRLLQESLGGRTKTSIIATISPGHKDLEETLSTLEYAYRAKNIQNKPEINQKMTKKAVLKEFSEEIDRLKRDLQASRDKNGVYLANETYTDIQLKIQDQEKDLQEKILAIKAMKEEKDKMEAIFNELSDNLRQKEEQLDVTNQHLSNTKNELHNTKNVLSSTKQLFEEQQHLVSKHSETEEKLSKQAKSLLGVADKVSDHVNCLHTTVDKRRNLEESNKKVTQDFSEKSQRHRTHMRDYLHRVTDTLVSDLVTLQESVDSHHEEYIQQETENKNTIDSLVKKMNETLQEVQSIRQLNEQSVNAAVSGKAAEVRDKMTCHASLLEDRLRALLREVVTQMTGARDKNHEAVQQMREYVCQWRDSNAKKVENLRVVQDRCLAEAQEQVRLATRRHQALLARQKEEYTRASHFYQEQKQKMDDDITQLRESFESEINRLSTRKDVCFEIITESSQSELVTLGDEEVLIKDLLTEAEKRMSSMGRETMESVKELKVFGEHFCDAVEERINHTKTETCECLDVAQGKIEAEIETAVSDGQLLVTECISNTEQMVCSIMDSHRETNASTFQHIQNFEEQYQRALSSVSESTSSLISAHNRHRHNTDDALARARDVTMEVRENISGELTNYHQMESAYLQQEYKTYSPTGKTPLRQDFRYPRMLAATSPHDRILERFRANRLGLKLEAADTVELLDDTLESPASSGEGGVVVGPEADSSADSDDSACVFLEPRLPQPYTPKQTQICKSTSESDIFTLMHNRMGKENLNRSASSMEKKVFTSKLRPPSSHKKALSDRN